MKCNMMIPLSKMPNKKKALSHKLNTFYTIKACFSYRYIIPVPLLSYSGKGYLYKYYYKTRNYDFWKIASISNMAEFADSISDIRDLPISISVCK